MGRRRRVLGSRSRGARRRMEAGMGMRVSGMWRILERSSRLLLGWLLLLRFEGMMVRSLEVGVEVRERSVEWDLCGNGLRCSFLKRQRK